MRWISLTLAVVAAISFATSGASASWSASVSGKVVNVQTLDPVSGAIVKVYTENGGQVLGKATSDAGGNFVVSGLRGGLYRLQFEKHGYQGTVVAGLTIRPSERLVEAAPIAMYPDGVPLPKMSANSPCGSLVDPQQTADVYIVCSGD
jgi:carboxypeptidase family protein